MVSPPIITKCAIGVMGLSLLLTLIGTGTSAFEATMYIKSLNISFTTVITLWATTVGGYSTVSTRITGVTCQSRSIQAASAFAILCIFACAATMALALATVLSTKVRFLAFASSLPRYLVPALSGVTAVFAMFVMIFIASVFNGSFCSGPGLNTIPNYGYGPCMPMFIVTMVIMPAAGAVFWLFSEGGKYSGAAAGAGAGAAAGGGGGGGEPLSEFSNI